MYRRMVLRRGWVSQPFGHRIRNDFRTSADRIFRFTFWCRDVDLNLRSDQTHMVSFFTLGNGRGDLAPTIGYTSCECQQNLATDRRFGGLKRVLLYPPRRFSSSICHSGSVIGIGSGAPNPASLRHRIKGCSRLGWGRSTRVPYAADSKIPIIISTT